MVLHLRDFVFIVHLRPNRRPLPWAYFGRVMTPALPPTFAVDPDV
jgi:hypothetical protein